MKPIAGIANRFVILQDYSKGIDPYNPKEYAKRKDKSPLAKEWTVRYFRFHSHHDCV